MKISSIKVNQIDTSGCLRQDFGDMDALVENVKNFGPYQPLLVGSDGKLKRNFRYCKAIKDAGIEEAPCVIWDGDQLSSLILQIRDNELHKSYTPSERVAIAKILSPYFKEQAQARLKAGGKLPSGNFPEGERGQAQDQVARLLGVSRPTLTKEMELCEAAAADPEHYGDLRDAMDRTGKINGFFKEMLVRRKRIESQEKYATAPDDRWVLQADFRDHIARQDFIPDNSVGLIFTDAPYLEEFVPLYGKLAEFGAAKLKPGAFLVTYYWGKYTARVIDLMNAHLKLFWVCGVYMTCPAYYRPLNIKSHLKLLLVYRKPPLDEIWWSPFEDVVSGGRAKENYEWEQPVEEAAHFIKALCLPGDIVVDPMAGSGTSLVAAKQLGYPYRGIEIDGARVKIIHGRLAETARVAEGDDHLTTEQTRGPDGNADPEAA